MKVLVINGSPKKEKSDTLKITNAFLAGMNEIEKQDIKIINCVEQNIKYCLGCFSCMRNGGNCVIKDDMANILNEMLESDLLLFSFPLYYYGMPAPLKTLMDRTLPFGSLAMKKEGDRYVHVVQKDVSKMHFMMICGCGFPNSKKNFEPVVMQFKQIFPHDNTVITVPESPMFNIKEAEPLTLPRLDLVRQAGKEYAKSFTISDELLANICSPMLDEAVYARMVNSELH